MAKKAKKYDDRAMSAPPTKATSVQRVGQYTIVELWANKFRFRLSFDRYLNLISIQRFVLKGSGLTYMTFYSWRQEFNRGYRRKKSLSPLFVDLVCCALEEAKHGRQQQSSRSGNAPRA